MRRPSAPEALRRQPALAVIPIAVAFILGLGIITHQWFTADEWSFIVNRDRPPLSDPGDFFGVLLRPHNEHWLTIPVIVYRAIFGVVGLRAYWPYLAVLLLCHALVVWLLIRRLRLDGVTGWPAAAFIGVFAVFGVGAENVLWAFQIAFVLPVALGLLYLELAGGPGLHAGASAAARRNWGWLCGLGAVMCSGVGLAMVAAVAIAVLLRRGWRAAVRAVWVPVAVYAVWYFTYGRAGTSETHVRWGDLPAALGPYVWRSLTLTFEGGLGLPGVGSICLLALLAAVVVWWSDLRNDHPEALALAAGSVLFLVLVAVGRAGFGDPGAGRYAYVNAALFLPLVSIVVTRVLRSAPSTGGSRSPVLRTVACVVAGLALLYSVGLLVDDGVRRGKRAERVRDRVSAAFVVSKSSFASGSAIFEGLAPDLTIDGVRRLSARGIVPWGQPSRGALTAMIARVSIDLTGRPRVPLATDAVSITAVGRATGQPIESGCVRILPFAPNPQVSLLTNRPASFKVVPLVAGNLTLYVKRDGRSARSATVPVSANNPVFVNLADPRNEYVIGLPTGAGSNLCGVGQELPG